MLSSKTTAGITAAAVVAAVGLGTAVFATASASASKYTVVGLADGVIALDQDGRASSTVLADVILPTAGDPNAACLASQTDAFLAGMLPVGSTVTVAPSGSGERVPVVVTANGKAVNVELVRAGLAAPAAAEGAGKAYKDILAARDEAAAAGAGLHSTAADCSIPSRAAGYEAAVADAAAKPLPTDLAGLDARLAELQALRTQGEEFVAVLGGSAAALPMAVHTTGQRTALAARAQTAMATLDSLKAAVQTSRDAEQARLDAAARERADKAAADKARAEREASELQSYYDSLFTPPADGIYDCIPPWDYADEWTQYDEDVYYACDASIG